MSETYGGQVVGRALVEGGVRHLFGVHGSINLAIEEANRLGAQMLHFRHEQSAGFAADAYARCLRRPGVCFASSAPGWTNLVSPIAQAKGALSPVVLLSGQHGVTGDDLGTIQEGQAAEVLRPLAKWTHRCLDWNMHTYWVRKALAESMQYAPGPVVLEFPRNALNAKGPNRQQKAPVGQLAPPVSLGDPQEVERVARLLLEAERPVIVAGDGVYWSHGEAALRLLAEHLRVPVHTRRTARGAVPETHALAFTGGYRARLLRDADVVCVVGLRPSWLEEWFEPPDWNRETTYVQIQETPGELWAALPTEAAIVGSCGAVLDQLLQAARGLAAEPPERGEWLAVLREARERYRERQAREVASRLEAPQVHPDVLGARLAGFLDPSATIVFDSFTGTAGFTDKIEAAFAGQILDAGLHQPVGHGIGMAVGAQVARPGRQVVVLMGDGGFGISAMDMETLLRYRLPAVVVLLNNSSWSGISAGQPQFYPEMGSWDNLPGIRYDRMFRELGCHGEHVERPEEIVPALDRAFSSGLPAVVNVVGDATDVHPLRMRICFGDVWTRGNLHELPQAGRDQLARYSTVAQLRRVQKFWLDNGVEIPLEDLAELAGVELETLAEA
jgi:acetolactate synthase-1/2/3 large subunit